MLINAAENLAEDVGVAPACECMGVARFGPLLQAHSEAASQRGGKIKAKPSQGA